ncbi:hypothetical protein [Flavobacterium piscisymbiosum]|uniref:Uncharacterized protein n=1 Tax=Flavobacterium piscisymbiosum TaxID=2893753 RepID=A0ABS8MNR7_9FLAO|nr:hypothetical protein [Flavobacterium sp. F-30]MCC9066290.1 hypothetical protein [Flavobacterium sp. F-30]
MAVKPEQIKARLKIKFPKANLSTKRIDALAAKLCLKPADDADDEAIDAVLETANDFMSFEEIAREDDRIRTLEANQKPKPEPTPTPTPTTDPDPNNPTPKPADDAPAWAKKIQEDLEALKSEKIIGSKTQTAQSLLDKSEILKGLKPDIKANWLKRIDLDSETPFEDQVTALETEYTELVQGVADSGDYAGRAPQGRPDAAKFSDAEAEKIVENIL